MISINVKEQLKSLPMEDVVVLSTLLTSLNKDLINSLDKLGQTVTIESFWVELPKSKAEARIEQDEITRMVSITNIVTGD